MKFSVGLNLKYENFTDYIIENKEHIYEVYFAWADFANGRNNQLVREGYSVAELIRIQENALKKLSGAGVKLNLLLNGNCYGKDALSRKFFEKIGTEADYIKTNYGLNSVTTTSPLIGKFFKDNFNDVFVRASVNMEIGTVSGMEYVMDYFDSFYIKRELNRKLENIKPLYEFAKENNKEIFMLANSGCLNFCSAHNFHDNLVAHETEISMMDNAYTFSGVCKEFLKKPENMEKIIENTNFVRPEDIDLYEEYFSAVKLATRVSNLPELILKSYISKKYSGDILSILEPKHNIYPYVVENGNPLKIVKIEDKGGIFDVNKQED